ncbi:MAG: hypothetical protein M3348_11705, partial [Acidobacteriota bacterium]|nr:hypothetical protein [Acidobacteriota bacterium]
CRRLREEQRGQKRARSGGAGEAVSSHLKFLSVRLAASRRGRLGAHARPGGVIIERREQAAA